MTVWRENPTARLVELEGSWWHEDPANPSWVHLGFAPAPIGRWQSFRYHVLHGLLMGYPLADVLRFAVHSGSYRPVIFAPKATESGGSGDHA